MPKLPTYPGKLGEDLDLCAAPRRGRPRLYDERSEACERLREYGRDLPQYEAAANEVRNRVDYGVRADTVPRKDCRRLAWSNASESWFAWAATEPRGTVRLDANEILVCGLGQNRAWALGLALPRLPLYENSYEAQAARVAGR